MINPFQAIVKEDYDFLEELLIKMGILNIFKPIFEAYPDNDISKKVVKFILYGYSIDSDMLLMQGNTWGKVALEIYEKVNLPEDKDFMLEIIDLKKPQLVETVNNWLYFQNDENWAQYITYRDLRHQMLTSSLSDIKTANGTEINYEQKMKNAIHSQTLLQMMNEAKETFIQNNSKLKSSVQTFNKATQANRNSRNVASYAVR